jgi:hypothetical protein
MMMNTVAKLLFITLLLVLIVPAVALTMLFNLPLLVVETIGGVTRRFSSGLAREPSQAGPSSAYRIERIILDGSTPCH